MCSTMSPSSCFADGPVTESTLVMLEVNAKEKLLVIPDSVVSPFAYSNDSSNTDVWYEYELPNGPLLVDPEIVLLVSWMMVTDALSCPLIVSLST